MTSGRPTISVVVPCLNAAEVLGVQLEALAGQEVPGSWEVIVVDNGSSDDTRAVAEAFRHRLPALTVVVESQRGRHHACNRGAAIAGGRSLVFVDADDEVQPGFLAAMAAALECHAMVAGRFDNTKFAAGGGLQHGQRQSDAIETGGGFLPFATGACTGIRADVFAAVGGFETEAHYCEDAALSWRVQLAGHDLSSVADAIVARRQRQSYGAMFRQHRNYGRGQVWLYRNFGASGMPRRSLKAVALEWFQLMRAVPFLADAAVRTRWIRRLGRNVGHVIGSYRYRTFYL
jgi:glycosyltransferase involved in cell wall biosynthesis